MIQVFYCTNTCEYTNIRSCRGKLVQPTRANICIYTCKLYNKANLNQLSDPDHISLFSIVLTGPFLSQSITAQVGSLKSVSIALNCVVFLGDFENGANNLRLINTQICVTAQLSCPVL